MRVCESISPGGGGLWGLLNVPNNYANSVLLSAVAAVAAVTQSGNQSSKRRTRMGFISMFSLFGSLLCRVSSSAGVPFRCGGICKRKLCLLACLVALILENGAKYDREMKER